MHTLLEEGIGGRTVVLAHGAGAPMDSDFMNEVSARLVARDFRTVRFEFPYMAGRREDGKKRGPNGAKVLLQTWREVVDQICPDGDASQLVIGGKSMGGRIASMVADEIGVAGLVCLGYPFHPPGKPEKLRTEHLRQLTTPCLIVQGERDPFGKSEEVAGYGLSPAIEVEWISDGDHSLVPRKRSGHTLDGNLDAAAEAIERFLSKLT